MTDAKDKNTNAPLTLSRPKLELKKTVEVGRVHQSFSNGRSKPVQVEMRKKRSFVKDAHGRVQVKDGETSVLDSEKEHRLKALMNAKKAEEEAKRLAEEEAKRSAEEAEKRAKEEAERKAAEEREAAARRAEEEKAKEKAAAVAAPAPAPRAVPEQKTVKKEARPEAAKRPFEQKRPVAPVSSPDDFDSADVRRKMPPKRRETRDDESRGGHSRRGGGEDKWRGGRVNLSNLMSGDDDRGERGRSLASIKRAREKERQSVRRCAVPNASSSL